MARSTPAQKPRGWQSLIVSGGFFSIMNSGRLSRKLSLCFDAIPDGKPLTLFLELLQAK
jgi:hypothetical protein